MGTTFIDFGNIAINIERIDNIEKEVIKVGNNDNLSKYNLCISQGTSVMTFKFENEDDLNMAYDELLLTIRNIVCTIELGKIQSSIKNSR